eukprot:c16415_g1_i2 orf=311-628(-)
MANHLLESDGVASSSRRYSVVIPQCCSPSCFTVHTVCHKTAGTLHSQVCKVKTEHAQLVKDAMGARQARNEEMHGWPGLSLSVYKTKQCKPSPLGLKATQYSVYV